MPRWVKIVGGIRDGDEVPFTGPIFKEPIPSKVSVIYQDRDLIPEQEPLKVREYELCKWRDGSTIHPRYVLKGHKLGQHG